MLLCDAGWDLRGRETALAKCLAWGFLGREKSHQLTLARGRRVRKAGVVARDSAVQRL